MKYLHKWLILIVFGLSQLPLKAQDTVNFRMVPQKVDCHLLPDAYQSLDEAERMIVGSVFRQSLKFQTTKQSGVMGGRFYSCDNKSGYLIIVVDKKTYIYKGMTSGIWNQLVHTNDPDSYYFDKIKGKLSQVTIKSN